MKRNVKKIYFKIGILGGSFDPPHKGHLHISKIALKKFKLDKVIWAVTKKNPLKQKPYLDLKTRVKLSKKITEKEKKIYIKFFDNKIKLNSTFNLLNHLKKIKPKMKLYFLIGADNLKKFHKWHNWEKIPKLAKIIVFSRKNYSFESFNSKAAKKINKNDWIFLRSKNINISSSLIKKIW